MRFSLLKFERLTNCWYPFVHTNRIVSLKLWLVAYNVGCFVYCTEKCHCHIVTMLKNIHIIIVLKEIQTDVWLAQMIRPVTDASVSALFNISMLSW